MGPRACLAIVVGALAGGCGASPPPTVTTSTTASTGPEDLTIDGGEVALTGVRFTPEAVAPPSMLLVHGTRTPTLEKQRTAWARLRGDKRAVVRKAVDGQVLVTALWNAARTDAARRGALLAEARAAVDVIHVATPGSTDETTLTMGAALAFAAGDEPGAQPYLNELVQRYGDRPGGTMARTQLAYARLRDGGDEIARALLDGIEPNPALAELAYVIAWTRFRGGDGPGAAAAITLAAQGWPVPGTVAAVERDFLVMHARSGLDLATAIDAVAAVTTEVPRRHALLYQLSTAYAFAGRPLEARGALDAALAALPAAPTELLPSVRLLQAEYVRRAGKIDDLPTAWRAAVAAIAACPACPASDRQAVGDGLAARAVEAHTIFATSGDPRYRRAAEDLYRQFAALPDVAQRADHAAVGQYAADFAQVRVPTDGAQYRDAIKGPLALRQQEVLACYEATLQGTPALGGAVALVIEIDPTGAIQGATTDPARGDADLARVAGCVEDRARAWQLPARARPGIARVSLRYVLGARP